MPAVPAMQPMPTRQPVQPPPTVYRPAPTDPKRRGAYSAYLLGALFLLVGSAFIADATLEDEPQGLTVADGMADSVLTYSEWPLRFSTLEECHDSAGLGRPGVMELDCDGEDYGVTGFSGVDVKGDAENVEQAINRAVRAIIFQDGVELKSTDVMNKLSVEDRATLEKAEVKQLRVTQSYSRGDQKYVGVAFVRDPDAAKKTKDGEGKEGREGAADTEPGNELEHSLQPDGKVPMVVVQVPVKSASLQEQMEEIGELVRGVRLGRERDSDGAKSNHREESTGEMDV